MAFIQRTTKEIHRSLLARMVARSELTDVSEGSVLFDLFATFAEQIADSEYRIAQVRQQFTLNNATGIDLDERASELGVNRLQATFATGQVVFTRSSANTSEALVIPAGSVIQALTTQAPRFYTTQEYIIPIGQVSVSASVQCAIAGSAGNIPSNTLTILISVPQAIISVTNSNAISNGQNLESDSALKTRCALYLKSLARCQAPSIEFFAKTFVGSDGSRCKNAHLYEDLLNPGYCELLIDDGSGLFNTVITSSTSSSFVVTGTQNPLIMPIARPVTLDSNIVLTRTRSSFVIPASKYKVIHERGIILFLDRTDLEDGDIITTNTYSVYQGLIPELQDQIEGDVKNATNFPGYRAIGVRVRVLPAPITNVSLDIQVTSYSGTDLLLLQLNTIDQATEFINSLDAGQPLFMAQLIDILMNDTRIQNIKIYNQNTLILSSDVYPSTDKHILKAQTINVFVSTQI